MLQQENAAPFDGVEEEKHMPEEPLPYEHVAPETKPEKADDWNNIHNPEDTNNHLDAMEDEGDKNFHWRLSFDNRPKKLQTNGKMPKSK